MHPIYFSLRPMLESTVLSSATHSEARPVFAECNVVALTICKEPKLFGVPGEKRRKVDGRSC